MTDARQKNDIVFRTRARDELSSSISFVEGNPELSQRQQLPIGRIVGVVNYALKARIERGLVEVDNFRNLEVR